MKFLAYFLVFSCFVCTYSIQAQEADASRVPPPRESAAAADKFTRGVQPDWATSISIPQTDSIKAPIVMLLADTQFLWAETKTFFVHRAIRVNEAGALSQVGQQTIEFNPEYQSLTLNTLRIIRGTEIIDKRDAIKVRFFERELEMEHGLYNGLCTAAILVDDLRVGDTLEIAYNVKGANPVFGEKIAEETSWEIDVPIKKRRVSAIYPQDREVRYQYIGGVNNDVRALPKISQRNGYKQLIFEQSDLKAVHGEERTPYGFQPFTWIQFSEYSDWQDVNKWAESLFRLPKPDTSDFVELMNRLNLIRDSNKKLAAALHFVQSDIRYTSISIGVNSHLPYAPSIVLSRRYGDCKDKSALLVAILERLGIKAKPVLASTNFRRGFSNWLPSPTVFDHVIVRAELDGAEYWMDPTLIQDPVNIDTLGRLHGGEEVLIVDGSTKVLTSIPQFLPDLVEEKQIVNFHGVDKPADLEVRTTYTGYAAEVLRSSLKQLTSDRIEKHYLDLIRLIYPGAYWKKTYDIMDDIENNKISVVRMFFVNDIAELENSYWHIYQRPDQILEFLEIPKASNRVSPYAIEYPAHFTFSQTINTPSDIVLANQQEAGAVADDYFRLKKLVRCRGTTATIEYDLISQTRDVSVKELPDFSNDVRRARSLLNSSLIISNK